MGSKGDLTKKIWDFVWMLSYVSGIYSWLILSLFTKGQLLNFFWLWVRAHARATLIFLWLARWRARADPEQEKVPTFIPMGLGWVSCFGGLQLD